MITALEAVLGERGTLLMPTHSTQLTDPQHWRNPAVPATWWPIIRQRTTPYDKQLTTTRNMGVVAELFRTQPGVLRSDHPHGSFAARGPQAEALTSDHALEEQWGERSPLGRLYDRGGHVLLLGVDHGNNTSLHLAECRAECAGKSWVEQGAPLLVDGRAQWVPFRSLDFDASDFAQLGEDFARDSSVESRGAVGWGVGRLMPQRAIVDFGQAWLETHRPIGP